jgi:hypothetical protein
MAISFGTLLQRVPTNPIAMKIQNSYKILLLSVCLLTYVAGAQIPSSGLKLWLRADAGSYQDASTTPSVNNTLVHTWLDQSGNGNHFNQIDTGKQPVYKTNILCSKPVIRFDISRRTFLQSNMLLGGLKTVFIVFVMPPMTNAARTLLSLKGPTDAFTEIVATDFPGYRPLTTVSDLPSTPGGGFYQPSVGINTAFSAQGNLVCMKFNGGAYSDPTSYEINMDNMINTVSGGGLLGRYNADITTIGARAPFQNINFLTGDIAEIIVYDRLLSAAETSSVSAYLIVKYGIANNCALPLHLRFFDLKKDAGKIIVEWKPEDETGLEKYLVQKSRDGINWITISGQPVRRSLVSTNYSAIDDRPLSGWNYYRIASISYSGETDFSITKKIFHGDGKESLKIYPNPASEYFIIEAKSSEAFQVLIRDNAGKLVKKEQVFTGKKISTAGLATGVYSIEITSGSFSQLHKLIIQ